MKRKIPLFLALLSVTLGVFAPPVFSYWVWSPEAGKFVNPEEAVQDTAEEQQDYAMGFYKKKDYKEAAKQFRLLVKAYPGSRVAPEAQFLLGDCHEKLGDYYRAFRSYRDLLQRFPGAERTAGAVERQFRIGNVFLSGKRAKLMGFSILPSGPRAVEVFKQITEAAPYSEYGDRAQFHLGLAYKKMNQFDSAVEAFQGVLDRYPQSPLLPQARFQMADTAYLQSIAENRDQRVIDRATDEIDQFLKHHPDSNVSDKAARLRQEIDEKNAEKNFRTGLFYEKENFLSSAFIYYRDVAERYPHTQGGKRAAERLQALEKPAEYLKSQGDKAAREIEEVRTEIQTAGDSDPGRKRELEEKLKRLGKEAKEIEKSKPEMLKRRRTALQQQEREWEARRKALEKKKKRFAKNPSEDLAESFERWDAALQKEKADLERERLRIQQWEESLGVNPLPVYARLLPFGKEAPTPVERVRRLEAERLEKLAREWKSIFEAKETLYREYEELVSLEGEAGEDREYTLQREKLQGLEGGIARLEKTLQEKQTLHEKNFGTSAWGAMWGVPKAVVERSVGALNPFDASQNKNWSSKSTEELEALRPQWKEKVESQKVLVDTIAQAFDDELAMAEEKRVRERVEAGETNPAELRRKIKQVEREIRGRYGEIQDRNERKNELLEQLEETLESRKGGGKGAGRGRGLTTSVGGAFRLGRAFFFGLPERDVKLTQEAEKVSQREPDDGTVRPLQEEIELESLLIDARNREIQVLERELDALRAQASLAGVPPFRSLLVKFPYVFVREAIVSAGRLIPKGDRKEKLIEQLNHETEELGRLRSEWAAIEAALKGKERSGPREERRKEKTEEAPPAGKKLDRGPLEHEIRSLQKQLKFVKESYDRERERFEKTRWTKLAGAREKAQTERLREIEEDLVKLIEKEQKIEQEERELLMKKRQAVEQFLADVPSDLFGQELELQAKEIDTRLHQLRNQESLLGEELKRFRPPQ